MVVGTRPGGATHRALLSHAARTRAGQKLVPVISPDMLGALQTAARYGAQARPGLSARQRGEALVRNMPHQSAWGPLGERAIGAMQTANRYGAQARPGLSAAQYVHQTQGGPGLIGGLVGYGRSIGGIGSSLVHGQLPTRANIGTVIGPLLPGRTMPTMTNTPGPVRRYG